MTAFHFNAREVEPDQGRVGAIPAGWYKTMVVKTEVKPTQGGDGMLIGASFQVVEGQFKGAMFFNNFNVQNQNEKAVEIGRKQLSALCHAVGVMEMSDTDQLKNIPFFTRLKLTPAEMKEDGVTIKYEEKNEPAAYKHIQDAMAVAQAAKSSAAPAPVVGAARPAAIPPQQQFPQQAQQFTPPPAAAPMQQHPAQFQQTVAPGMAMPPMQQQAPQQFAPPQQAPQQFAPAAAPAGQPDWANAQQPWGQPAAPAGQPAQAQVAPVLTPEQQQQHAAAMAAPVPWGAPQ